MSYVILCPFCRVGFVSHYEGGGDRLFCHTCKLELEPITIYKIDESKKVNREVDMTKEIVYIKKDNKKWWSKLW